MYWTFSLLTILTLLGLCTGRPATQPQRSLQKRGDPYGEGLGPASYDGNDNNDQANHPFYEQQHMKHYRRKFPGPDKEPNNVQGDCDRKAWVFWLSFNAHQHDFSKHRKNRDILCLPASAWVSDACTRAADKPFNSFEFKGPCQRQDFANLNLKKYIERAKTLTEEQRERENLNFAIKDEIKERFRTDLINACWPEKGGRLLCTFIGNFYYIFHH